jgi:deazaflavin-dependent oxidoreductase (nitroreductase family)
LNIARPRTGNFLLKLRQIMATRAGIFLFASSLHIIDRISLKLSDGQTALSGAIGGLPIITLKTRGAKSGETRSVPLICIPNSDGIILVASNWGRAGHPGWYHNLKAKPAVLVTYRNQTGRYLARETEGGERLTCWDEAVEVYPGYEVYQARCPGRQIPVIWLTPIAEPEQNSIG